MKNYVSKTPTTKPGYYVEPGTPFPYDGEPAEDWETVTVKEAAAIDAAERRVPDDADLEALPLTALKAVAFLCYVPNIDKLDAEGLKAAIRAHYEPAL